MELTLEFGNSEFCNWVCTVTGNQKNYSFLRSLGWSSRNLNKQKFSSWNWFTRVNQTPPYTSESGPTLISIACFVRIQPAISQDHFQDFDAQQVDMYSLKTYIHHNLAVLKRRLIRGKSPWPTSHDPRPPVLCFLCHWFRVCLCRPFPTCSYPHP